MNLIYLLPLLAILIPTAYAQTENITDEDIRFAGITPDHPLYFFDKLLDDIRFNLADVRNGDQTIIGLEIANERLAERNILILRGQYTLADIAGADHETKLERIKASIAEIKDDNSERELAFKLRVETRIIDHDNKIKIDRERIVDGVIGKIPEDRLVRISQSYDELDIETIRDSIKEKRLQSENTIRTELDSNTARLMIAEAKDKANMEQDRDRTSNIIEKYYVTAKTDRTDTSSGSGSTGSGTGSDSGGNWWRFVQCNLNEIKQ